MERSFTAACNHLNNNKEKNWFIQLKRTCRLDFEMNKATVQGLYPNRRRGEATDPYPHFYCYHQRLSHHSRPRTGAYCFFFAVNHNSEALVGCFGDREKKKKKALKKGKFQFRGRPRPREAARKSREAGTRRVIV